MENNKIPDSFELGPIRPPSEAYSLLIRVTENCPWNKCRFCPTYKGEKFRIRPVEAVKQDILTVKSIADKIKEIAVRFGTPQRFDQAALLVLQNPPNQAYYNVALWLYSGGENAFLQDANTLVVKTPDLVEIISFLKETLPSITRITSYGRSQTAARKTVEELTALHEAGLSRLHIGMESGYDPALQYMEKGVTAAEHIKGGKNIVASGISLCEYVLLGVGGKKMSQEHARETARVLNEINPDFIRVRTLTVKQGMPLYDDVENGSFVMASDEEIIAEEKLLIENLDCQSNFISDHITNLLQEIEGKLPEDKAKMLAIVARFEALPPPEKMNFIVGRRTGMYSCLDDMSDAHRYDAVEQTVSRITREGKLDEKVIRTLMGRFI